MNAPPLGQKGAWIIQSGGMQRLTDFEREKIEYFVHCRLGIREIGRLLKSDYAVVSREIRRNTGVSSRYTAVSAKKKTGRKARLTNTCILDTNPLPP
jgi:IS30 family transposase